jgi:hypothetical protein
VTPQFSFGCGSNDGSAACDLGAMDAKSAERQLQAQIAIAATSTTKSVKLTVIGSAAHLKKDPEATATLPITGPVIPAATTSPLPVGSLPAVSTPSPSLTPGGNAGGLFPTIDPSPSTSAGKVGKKTATRAVADTAALPEGASVVGAQLVGLGALAVAFILAVTRLSVRRRPALATGLEAQPGTPGAAPNGQPQTPDNGSSDNGTADSTPDNGTPDNSTDKSQDAPAASDGSQDAASPAPEQPARPEE